MISGICRGANNLVTLIKKIFKNISKILKKISKSLKKISKFSKISKKFSNLKIYRKNLKISKIIKKIFVTFFSDLFAPSGFVRFLEYLHIDYFNF
jgi:hypothetical protein